MNTATLPDIAVCPHCGTAPRLNNEPRPLAGSFSRPMQPAPVQCPSCGYGVTAYSGAPLVSDMQSSVQSWNLSASLQRA